MGAVKVKNEQKLFTDEVFSIVDFAVVLFLSNKGTAHTNRSPGSQNDDDGRLGEV